jgi:hypothetical protein
VNHNKLLSSSNTIVRKEAKRIILIATVCNFKK